MGVATCLMVYHQWSVIWRHLPTAAPRPSVSLLHIQGRRRSQSGLVSRVFYERLLSARWTNIKIVPSTTFLLFRLTFQTSSSARSPSWRHVPAEERHVTMIFNARLLIHAFICGGLPQFEHCLSHTDLLIDHDFQWYSHKHIILISILIF